jgi:hypothetical protein
MYNKSRGVGLQVLAIIFHFSVGREYDRGQGAGAFQGITTFRDFWFKESTFKWGGGVSPFQLCQET